MTIEEIAACPFCGKPAEAYEDDGYWKIICPFSDCLIVPFGKALDKDSAIAAWNHRTIESELKSEIESTKQLISYGITEIDSLQAEIKELEADKDNRDHLLASCEVQLNFRVIACECDPICRDCNDNNKLSATITKARK